MILATGGASAFGQKVWSGTQDTNWDTSTKNWDGGTDDFDLGNSVEFSDPLAPLNVTLTRDIRVGTVRIETGGYQIDLNGYDLYQTSDNDSIYDDDANYATFTNTAGDLSTFRFSGSNGWGGSSYSVFTGNLQLETYGHPFGLFAENSYTGGTYALGNVLRTNDPNGFGTTDGDTYAWVAPGTTDINDNEDYGWVDVRNIDTEETFRALTLYSPAVRSFAGSTQIQNGDDGTESAIAALVLEDLAANGLYAGLETGMASIGGDGDLTIRGTVTEAVAGKGLYVWCEGGSARTVTFEGDASYTGATDIMQGTLVLASGGKLSGTSEVLVNDGAALRMDNADQVVADRVVDAASIVLRGGTIELVGNTAGAKSAVAETIGTVAAQYAGTVRVTGGNDGNVASLTLAGLTPLGGSVSFDVDPYNQVFLTGQADGVIGGHALINGNFATYDATAGVTNGAAAYTAAFDADAAGQDANITTLSGSVTQTVDKTVAGLVMQGAPPVSLDLGGNTLYTTGVRRQDANGFAISNGTIDAGTSPLYVYLSGYDSTISADIVSGGLSLDGDNDQTVTLSGDNSQMAGPIVVRDANLALGSSTALGTPTDLRVDDATLTVTQDTAFSGGLFVDNGGVTFDVADGKTISFDGELSAFARYGSDIVKTGAGALLLPKTGGMRVDLDFQDGSMLGIGTYDVGAIPTSDGLVLMAYGDGADSKAEFDVPTDGNVIVLSDKTGDDDFVIDASGDGTTTLLINQGMHAGNVRFGDNFNGVIYVDGGKVAVDRLRDLCGENEVYDATIEDATLEHTGQYSEDPDRGFLFVGETTYRKLNTGATLKESFTIAQDANFTAELGDNKISARQSFTTLGNNVLTFTGTNEWQILGDMVLGDDVTLDASGLDEFGTWSHSGDQGTLTAGDRAKLKFTGSVTDFDTNGAFVTVGADSTVWLDNDVTFDGDTTFGAGTTIQIAQTADVGFSRNGLNVFGDNVIVNIDANDADGGYDGVRFEEFNNNAYIQFGSGATLNVNESGSMEAGKDISFGDGTTINVAGKLNMLKSVTYGNNVEINVIGDGELRYGTGDNEQIVAGENVTLNVGPDATLNVSYYQLDVDAFDGMDVNYLPDGEVEFNAEAEDGAVWRMGDVYAPNVDDVRLEHRATLAVERIRAQAVTFEGGGNETYLTALELVEGDSPWAAGVSEFAADLSNDGDFAIELNNNAVMLLDLINVPGSLAGDSNEAIVRAMIDANNIVSSLVATDGLSTGIGVADQADDSVKVAYTYQGDASVDGVVDTQDLAKLAANWGASSPDLTWDMADFNLDGNVDTQDLAKLAANWQKDIRNAKGGAVPEPMTLGVLALGGLAVLRRRRK